MRSMGPPSYERHWASPPPTPAERVPALRDRRGGNGIGKRIWRTGWKPVLRDDNGGRDTKDIFAEGRHPCLPVEARAVVTPFVVVVGRGALRAPACTEIAGSGLGWKPEPRDNKHTYAEGRHPCLPPLSFVFVFGRGALRAPASLLTSIAA